MGSSAVLQANAGLFDTVFAPFSAAAPLARARWRSCSAAALRAKPWASSWGTAAAICADEAVTWEQLAVILWRLAGCPGRSRFPPSATASLSPWARDAVNRAVASGRLSLDAGGAVRPDGTVTKADLGL